MRNAAPAPARKPGPLIRGSGYLGLQVFVVASHTSVVVQSPGPVGAGVDGDVWAKADNPNILTKPLRRAAGRNLRMLHFSMEV